MKSIYRKSALEKLSSVDQLDKALKVTSAKSWIALLAITAILAMTVFWAFTGTLPSTVTAAGVVVNSETSTNTILSTVRGTVQEMIPRGNKVNPQTNVVMVNGTERFIKSNHNGIVGDLLVRPGDSVEIGTEVIRLRPDLPQHQKHVAVCYVPVSDADKIHPGQTAHVTLTSVNSSTYGYMEARVIDVDTWATSTKGMEAVVGGDNNMIQQLTNNGNGVCAVTCELLIDSATGKYQWSTEKGSQHEVAAPQLCSIKIITSTERPITKLFTKLQEIWENKGS